MPADVTKLGPGTLTLGSTGTEVDFSCQITGAKIAWSVNADDPVPTMCGDTVAGDRVYSSVLSGSLFLDVGLPGGILYYSWDHKGESVPFTFTPNTAAEASAAGTLILDPLDFGGDESGKNMTADFEWTCVGDPVLTPPAGGGATTADAPDVELVGVG